MGDGESIEDSPMRAAAAQEEERVPTNGESASPPKEPMSEDE
jgi:hypothetical protein